MRDILVLNEAQLRGSVGLGLATVGVVEDAFRALTTGQVVMPPVLSMKTPAAQDTAIATFALQAARAAAAGTVNQP